jgi:hypothetical protein
MPDILEIIKNIETIYSTNSTLSALKDFERVLDEMNMYVYKNWQDGELAFGPKIDRHFITASFMWPRERMPDPMAAKRLLEFGCKIKYERTHLLEPRKIKSPDDFRPGTRKGKIDRRPVWVVEITMPKKLVENIYNGHMTKMKEQLGIGREATAEATPAAGAAPQMPMPGAMPAAGAAPAALPAGGAAGAVPTA